MTMNGRFIYVFSEDAKDALLRLGFQQLKTDGAGKIFIFANDQAKFVEMPEGCVLSDTLTF